VAGAVIVIQPVLVVLAELVVAAPELQGWVLLLVVAQRTLVGAAVGLEALVVLVALAAQVS
jgi:hypothetical protein